MFKSVIHLTATLPTKHFPIPDECCTFEKMDVPTIYK